MLNPECWRQEVGIRGAKAVVRGVVLQQVSEVVMEGFVSEGKDTE